MSSTLEFQLVGGLGNQLFQCAAGLNVESTTGRKIRFSTSILDLRNNGNVTSRNLAIKEILEQSELNSAWLSQKLSLFRIKFQKSSVVTERDLADYALSRITADTKIVMGYFQNWEIVDSEWANLSKRFISSQKFSGLVTSEKINRVAVHLRFGDYRTNINARNFHGLTHSDYYIEAIEKHLMRDKSISEVALITDESNQAVTLRDLILHKFDLPVAIISSDSPIQDLIEISKSSHIVMSNSSFSWWAAWIGHKLHGSRVVMPTPWFARAEEVSPNLLVPGWESLSRKLDLSL